MVPFRGAQDALCDDVLSTIAIDSSGDNGTPLCWNYSSKAVHAVLIGTHLNDITIISVTFTFSSKDHQRSMAKVR